MTAPAAAAPVLVDGGYRVGATSTVRLEGAWEAGSEVVTKVVANVGGTPQDAVSNSGTEMAIAST